MIRGSLWLGLEIDLATDMSGVRLDEGRLLEPAAAAPSVVTELMMHSRLSEAANSQSGGHKTPYTVSVHVGPISVSAGGRLLRVKNTLVELVSDAADPDAPSYLSYTAQTEHGLLIGVGAGSSGASLGVYGGGSRGNHIAFRRRVDRLEDKQELALAARSQNLPKESRWAQIPDPHAIERFAIGEVWEQTAVTRFGSGVKLGHFAQKLDIGADVVGQFVVRVEKTAWDRATVTVIPIRFKRIYTDTGNLLEKLSREREETSGRSLTYRFRLDTHDGLRAYHAIVDAHLPDVDVLSEDASLDPVVLLRRGTVQQSTVRRSLTLLRGRLGLFSSDRAATQAAETSLSRMTLQTTGHDDLRKGYNGQEQHEWEVHACYSDRIEGGVLRKEFLEMVVYQRYALKSADRTLRSLLRKSDELALRDRRNAQLQALSHALGHQLPSFDLPQVQGQFAVELLFVLRPAHIDALSHMRAEDVRQAAEACDLGRRQTQEVVDAFGEMQRIEAASDASKWQTTASHHSHRHSFGFSGIVHAAQQAFDVNVDDRLSRDYALIDEDATARQAQILQRFLRKPNVLRMLTTFLARYQLASAPSVAIDCLAYDLADEAVSDLDALHDTTLRAREPRKLESALQRLAAVEQALVEAVATAESDALSKQYDNADWLANQILWRQALDRVGELRSFEHLQARSDGARMLLDDDDVFKAASIVQRVGVLAQAIQSGGSEHKLRKLAHRLDDVLEDMDDALEDLYDVLTDEHGAPNAEDVLRWQGRRLLDALSSLAAQIQPHAIDSGSLRRQLDHMHVLLTPEARAIFAERDDAPASDYTAQSLLQ